MIIQSARSDRRDDLANIKHFPLISLSFSGVRARVASPDWARSFGVRRRERLRFPRWRSYVPSCTRQIGDSARADGAGPSAVKNSPVVGMTSSSRNVWGVF